MPELLGCLSALDQSAESAVRVIAYFDALVDGHAGLDAFIRGAAVLAGCSAGLHDPGRGSRIRMDAQGRRLDFGHADPADGWPAVWMDSQLARVWLERDTAPAPTDSMILERLAAGSRVVLDHTRGRSPVRSAAGDPALAEVLIDDEARASVRVSAAHRLGLGDATTVCAVETMRLAAAYTSLRQAAAALHLHHSTLQARAGQLQRALGYSLDAADGRNRLYLAPILRRLHRNGDLPWLPGKQSPGRRGSAGAPGSPGVRGRSRRDRIALCRIALCRKAS